MSEKAAMSELMRRRYGVWVEVDPAKVALRARVMAALDKTPLSRKEIEQEFGLTPTEGRQLCALMLTDGHVTMSTRRLGERKSTVVYTAKRATE